MEFRGIMGGFYRISEWIMRLSAINVLWVLCASPFFVFGLSILQAETLDQILSTLIVLAILSPFTLFPSTAAMYCVARKWLTGEEDAPLLKTFFRGYKENFVHSMLAGIIYTLIAVILYTNLRYYGNQGGFLGILRYLVLTISVVISISFFHFFSILSHLHMKLFQIIKSSLIITIGHPIRTITMVIGNGLVLYLSFTQFTFLIPFFMGSLIALISFWHFNLIFGKLQVTQQRMAEEEAAKEAERNQLNTDTHQPEDQEQTSTVMAEMEKQEQDRKDKSEKP